MKFNQLSSMLNSMERKRNRRLKDYSGIRFGRLVGVSLVEREWTQNDHKWLFRCDCGQEKIARIKLVRGGHTSSCGCLAREITVARNTTHGLSRVHTHEYKCWKDMRSRCANEKNTEYTNYGGRGISVCDRWGDFSAFFYDMGKAPQDMTLDRIDVNGNYEPGNCRWATAITQANNRRNNHVLTVDGVTGTLAQLCSIYKIDPSKVRYRLKVGYSAVEAFSNRDARHVRANAPN